jgi:signal transduction histidine kinase
MLHNRHVDAVDMDTRKNSPPRPPTTKTNPFGTRMVLIAGFSGLLAIMTLAGIYSLRIAREIQDSNTQMRRDFLARDRTLDKIRSDLYESGTAVRDFILVGNDEQAAASLLAELRSIHADMQSSLKSYSHSLRPDELDAFHDLVTETESYWATMNPVFNWDAQTKRTQGISFLSHEVLPRRMTVLNMAREIAKVNEQSLQEDERRVTEKYAQFRSRLQAITAFGLCLSLVLAGLTIVHTLRLEKVTGEQYQKSLRDQAELKELSARLVDAQESERRAISMELHDEVGQSLTALLMDVDRLASQSRPGTSMRESLDKIKLQAENTVNVIRNMSLLLRPSMLDDLGLVAALEWQAREVTKRTGMLVDLAEENVSDSLPEEHRTCVYRVVQEALNNCSKHAHARRVQILVHQQPDRLALNIQDDGRGFDANRVRGLGLLGMSERVAHLNGTLKIESEEGRGTSLRIELPLEIQPSREAAMDRVAS